MEKAQSVYEKEQISAALDELKFQLLKLHLMHETTLQGREKDLVQEALPSEATSFGDLIKGKTLAAVNKAAAEFEEEPVAPAFWQGTRLEAEMPHPEGREFSLFTKEKNIMPELLNQRFLWHDSYHQYADWKAKLRAAYDQFNLMELPQTSKEAPTFYFEKTNFNRRIPTGVFPDAKGKRRVLQPPRAGEQSSLRDATSLIDPLTKFERDPMAQMLSAELQRNAQSASEEVDEQTLMMVNLQNIKQGIKSDYNDH